MNFILENIIYAEIIYDTNKLISTNPYLLIENKSIMNDNTNIICILKNYTYLIKVIKNTVINYPFNLYENTIIERIHVRLSKGQRTNNTSSHLCLSFFVSTRMNREFPNDSKTDTHTSAADPRPL